MEEKKTEQSLVDTDTDPDWRQAKKNLIDMQKQKASTMLQDYLKGGSICDFSAIPSYVKLSLLQNIKVWKKFKPIQFRRIGKTQIPYIKHQFARKCLNFVFNFNVDCEIIGEPTFVEGTQSCMDWKTKKHKDKPTYEACVLVKFTFTDESNKKIIKTVNASHKGFQNPATSRFSVINAAISKAYTVAARQFGIGDDFEEVQERAYQRVEQRQPAQKQVKKSFTY